MNEKKTYIVRWIGVMVAFVSIIVNVYLFMLKEKEKSLADSLGEKIYELSSDLLRSEQREAAHKAQDKVYQDSIQALLERNKASLIREQNALIQAHYHKKTVEKLNERLNEKITVIDISDNEHLKLFFDWAKPIE